MTSGEPKSEHSPVTLLFPGSDAFPPDLAQQLHGYLNEITAMETIIGSKSKHSIIVKAEEARDAFVHTLLVMLKTRIIDDDKLGDSHRHGYKHHSEIAKFESFARTHPQDIRLLPMLALAEYQNSGLCHPEFAKYDIPSEVIKRLDKLDKK